MASHSGRRAATASGSSTSCSTSAAARLTTSMKKLPPRLTARFLGAGGGTGFGLGFGFGLRDRRRLRCEFRRRGRAFVPDQQGLAALIEPGGGISGGFHEAIAGR